MCSFFHLAGSGFSLPAQLRPACDYQSFSLSQKFSLVFPTVLKYYPNYLSYCSARFSPKL